MKWDRWASPMSTLFLSDCMPQDLPGLPVHMYMGSHVASFQGLSHFWSSVRVQDNTQKWKSGENQARPGNTYHMKDVRWMREVDVEREESTSKYMK